jgi:hypothetical protein
MDASDVHRPLLDTGYHYTGAGVIGEAEDGSW